MQRGYIIPIGGAEEKEGDPQILSRFVEICGGRNARILILPTASRLENTGHRYERIFRDLGAASARALPLEERSDGSREDFIAALDEADGFS